MRNDYNICSAILEAEGKPYPKTCPIHGVFTPCKVVKPEPLATVINFPTKVTISGITFSDEAYKVFSTAGSLLGPDKGHDEYERAIVEMVGDLLGYNGDDRSLIIAILDYFRN